MTEMKFVPSYLRLLHSGELEYRIELADSILYSCICCPHRCGVNRMDGNRGICRSSIKPIVSAYTLHHGEEPVISGKKGAGNIFFGNCNLRCVFCQNHEISQNDKAEKKHEISCEQLADIMIELQKNDAHNIGLVSPSHFSVQILKAIYLAAEKGLNIPIIYNSNGYDCVEMLRLFEGVIDIYLPDIKYGNNENGKMFSNCENYFDTAKKAVKEMHRQVGSNLILKDEVAVKGLIIRHLVLPNNIADSENVFNFISNELSPDIHISVMSQYYPANKGKEYQLLSRNITKSEYEIVFQLLDKYGLENGWCQELSSNNFYRPDFISDRQSPFIK